MKKMKKKEDEEERSRRRKMKRKRKKKKALYLFLAHLSQKGFAVNLMMMIVTYTASIGLAHT